MSCQEKECPVVSVCCICYNHARYLRQALDSVLAQKTDFSFEILVHDDASTDGSQEIILEYQKKNPNLIFPVLQKENQYSKGVRLFNTFLLPRIRGELYIALECDDFWCDEYKLQKQVDALREHPDCVMCVHRVSVVQEDGTPKGIFVPQQQLPAQIIGEEENVKLVAEDVLFHTTCRLIRTEVKRQLVEECPSWCDVSKFVGDRPEMLYFACAGNVYYIADTLTCYRQGSVGSYTQRLGTDRNFFLTVRRQLAEMWHLFGQEHPKYAAIAQNAELQYRKEALWEELKNCKPRYLWKISRGQQNEIYRQLTIREKLKLWIRAWFPWLTFVVRKARKVLCK